METQDDLTVIAVVAAYDSMHAALIAKAQQCESRNQPLSARVLRYNAAIVARAALAEEVDPEPAK